MGKNKRKKNGIKGRGIVKLDTINKIVEIKELDQKGQKKQSDQKGRGNNKNKMVRLEGSGERKKYE